MTDSEVFCDYLGVTVPQGEWEDLQADLAPVLDMAGIVEEFRDGRVVLWRHAASHGTVKASRMGQVWALGASGAACGVLRAMSMFGEYLSAIGQRMHRVTRLDASCDVLADAAPIVEGLERRGYAGELSLTRKAIRPEHVVKLSGCRPDGVVSGTVYCGSKSAEARMVVYDKTLERFRRTGEWDVDSPKVTRYELRVRSQMRPTLRDAYSPGPMFWHFASPGFLPAPVGVSPWVAHGDGFELPPRDVPLPAQRLKRRVDDSAELPTLLALADQVGPHGFDFLVGLLRARMPAPLPV